MRKRFPAYDSKNKGVKYSSYVIDPFMQLIQGRYGPIVELGAGNGASAIEMAKRGCTVVCQDIAETAGCHTVQAGGVTSFCFNAWEPWPTPVKGDWVFSTDFMEHLPEEKVDEVCKRIRENIRVGGMMLICITGDGTGNKAGVGPLHLTVHDEGWWTRKFSNYFKTVRTLQKPSGCHCLIYFEIY